MSAGHKNAFNTVTTFLILILGLNFFEAFKALAKSSSSWVIALRPWTQHERDLIEDLDSLTSVVRLGFRVGLKYGTVWMCVAWVMLNLLAQTGVAIISLTYSINDGKSYNDTYLRAGTVQASKLSCYHNLFNGANCTSNDANDGTNQALAHAYGELALSSPCAPYNATVDLWHYKYNFGYYCNRTPLQQQFADRFNEYNPEDDHKLYPHITNRTITASGFCVNYSLVGEPEDRKGGLLLYKYKNETTSGNITIPAQSGAFAGTTWIYRDRESPQNACTSKCGDRCIKVWAHRSRVLSGSDAGEPIQFYECSTTMGHVSNQTDAAKDIPDDMARLAIASIALQGRQSSDNDWASTQFYPWGSEYEVHEREPDQVAADIAEFAISSISTMAKNAEPITLPDSEVPHLGSRLFVHWPYLTPLAAGISGVHLALYLSAVYLTPSN